jgi:hypothetical protein
MAPNAASAPALAINDMDWVLSMRLRLGLPLVSVGTGGFRCHCGTQVDDFDVDHYTKCSHIGHSRYGRHTGLGAAARRVATRAGVPSQWEPRMQEFRE